MSNLRKTFGLNPDGCIKRENYEVCVKESPRTLADYFAKEKQLYDVEMTRSGRLYDSVARANKEAVMQYIKRFENSNLNDE